MHCRCGAVLNIPDHLADIADWCCVACSGKPDKSLNPYDDGKTPVPQSRPKPQKKRETCLVCGGPIDGASFSYCKACCSEKAAQAKARRRAEFNVPIERRNLDYVQRTA